VILKLNLIVANPKTPFKCNINLIRRLNFNEFVAMNASEPVYSTYLLLLILIQAPLSSPPCVSGYVTVLTPSSHVVLSNFEQTVALDL